MCNNGDAKKPAFYVWCDACLLIRLIRWRTRNAQVIGSSPIAGSKTDMGFGDLSSASAGFSSTPKATGICEAASGVAPMQEQIGSPLIHEAAFCFSRSAVREGRRRGVRRPLSEIAKTVPRHQWFQTVPRHQTFRQIAFPPPSSTPRESSNYGLQTVSCRSGKRDRRSSTFRGDSRMSLI